jgi:hypothetical protein
MIFVTFGAEKPVVVCNVVAAQSAFAAGLQWRLRFTMSFGRSLVPKVKLLLPLGLAVGRVAHGPAVLRAGNIGPAVFTGSFR